MCIYCSTNKYRKIYENHIGKIPIDIDGRNFEVHHIDGNRLNNKPANLIALSISDHYDIHYAQGDYGACYLISKNMNLTQAELSALATLNNNKRMQNGTHNFIGKSNPVYSRIENKAQSLHSTKVQNARIIDKTHNFLIGKSGKSNTNYDPTIYKFQNKITQEIISAAQYDMVRLYNLAQGSLSQVVHNKLKSTGGWILVK